MKPEWLKIKPPEGAEYERVKSVLKNYNLKTVCQSSHCPNIPECWEKLSSTFMILGDICTRNCTFCAVKKGKPLPPDKEEPKRIASAVSELGLDYVVITSVDRDDLADGGAAHYAECINQIKSLNPSTVVEVLIPDFAGKAESIRVILSAGPEVVAHNLEAVRRLQSLVRDARSTYERSLFVLKELKKLSSKTITKASLLLGLGENSEEVREAMKDIKKAGVDILVLGQYLAPSKKHTPVAEYLPPGKFDSYRTEAEKMGFVCLAEPFARGSFKGEELYRRFKNEKSFA